MGAGEWGYYVLLSCACLFDLLFNVPVYFWTRTLCAPWFFFHTQIPRESAVLDYVFSDRDQVNWDNNDQRDFHTLVDGECCERAAVLYPVVFASCVSEGPCHALACRVMACSIKCFVRGGLTQEHRTPHHTWQTQSDDFPFHVVKMHIQMP